MKKILIIINISALIAALIWLKTDQEWEPLITSLGLIGSLIVQIYSNSKNQTKIKFTQKGGKNSTNYQAKGNINITKND